MLEAVMFDRLVERFCEFDDFCQFIRTEWAAYLVANGHQRQRQPGPRGGLCESEIMLLLVLYHSSRFKNFKTFYYYSVTKSSCLCYSGRIEVWHGRGSRGFSGCGSATISGLCGAPGTEYRPYR